MSLWGMQNTGSAFVVANVLHSELCVSGQSQVLRTETFSYVYQKKKRKKKMEPKDVLIPLLPYTFIPLSRTWFILKSFPEFISC